MTRGIVVGISHKLVLTMSGRSSCDAISVHFTWGLYDRSEAVDCRESLDLERDWPESTGTRAPNTL